MYLNDYQESYVEFCTEEILREITLSKRRFLRDEKFHKAQCTLNEKFDNEVEGVELIIDPNSSNFDDNFDFEDNIENEQLVKGMKLLSSREKKVVSLRYRDNYQIDEIRIVLGVKSLSIPHKICERAHCKIRNKMEGKKNGNK